MTTTEPVTIVGLVGCAAAKLKRPAPARDLYTSALFRKSTAYVEHHADRWYVLSAKHGLVRPDRVIEPYNVKLGRNQALPIWDWARMVNEQLVRELSGVPNVRLLVLAGEQYRTILEGTAKPTYPYDVPMKGLGIGEQLGFLTREAAARQEAPRHGASSVSAGQRLVGGCAVLDAPRTSGAVDCTP